MDGIGSWSWYLALNYMTIGKIVEARALILNDCFLQQCYVSASVGSKHAPLCVVACSYSIASAPEQAHRRDRGHRRVGPRRVLPRAAALLHRRTPRYHVRGSHRGLPAQQRVVRLPAPDELRHPDAADAGEGAGLRRPDLGRLAQRPPDAERIEVRLVDGRTGEAMVGRYGAATTTKALFKQYAEDRGASLRQLRFSHRETTLFLSSVGHRRARDLGIRHLDEIVVTNSATAAAPPTPREDGGASDGSPVDGADEARERPFRKVTPRQLGRAGDRRRGGAARAQALVAALPGAHRGRPAVRAAAPEVTRADPGVHAAQGEGGAAAAARGARAARRSGASSSTCRSSAGCSSRPPRSSPGGARSYTR